MRLPAGSPRPLRPPTVFRDVRPRGPRDSGAPLPGFTLLELMIVTVLLGVLAAIAVPVYQGFRRDAVASALRQQLRNVAQAEQMHFLEHDVYTDDVDRLDYRPTTRLQLELRVGRAGGGVSAGTRDAGRTVRAFGTASIAVEIG